ncbi:sugar transferase [Ureibacillus aquaedulcis]|uniref:Sugar transferase n=1 Tax=Ureibacillus aquaedulcis TaxID=3058421 RepID=A0ABT8GUL8_9BACL|nr:sugar transferase [Ureibacillus sp. BA0131]MDN4495111.1 sugar transferase [Ureibacillus sp. BA0131]
MVPIEKAKEQVIPITLNDSKFYLLNKRLLDILCSISGLFILTPGFFLLAIIMKIEDARGKVLFKQVRVGKDGKEFYMYKFRSMVSNAEELKDHLLEQNDMKDGPVFKMKQDPRVTKLGRFIRKTSIDELPQLVNVLKGDMTLVGPRPPLPSEVAQYTSYERQRLSVTPGLTCYWQVSGRSNIGFEEWVRLDLKYIQERNIMLDIKLILKTVFVLLGSKDAY